MVDRCIELLNASISGQGILFASHCGLIGFVPSMGAVKLENRNIIYFRYLGDINR
ncbi:hypothetical protein GPLA_0999 [Paraglaciecola polaris LMG 21857]|uniref:Uncharacterized protein n=1 Tax=Paraglaciecola polaris LMG 21857 TaxID=1129793 RepID=K7A918_9ALTE|nr:hypothetical protein GPLA_0999 [Paraglaciecola polaris LMG 21857]